METPYNNNNMRDENPNRALAKPGYYPLSQSGYQYSYPDAEELHIRDYIQVILRRKWIVITFLIAVMSTVTIGTFMMKPLYKATTTLKIDKDNTQVVVFKDSYAIEDVNDKYYQTQYKVLKSRNLAQRVIRKMKLYANPEFSVEKTEKSSAQASHFLKRNANLQNTQINSDLVNSFINRIDIEPQSKSSLVNVSFESYDPELSSDVTNTIAQAFIELNIESKFEATQQARSWLQNQIEIMKAKLEQAEENLNDYAARNEIIFLDYSVSKDGEATSAENIITKRLADLSSELTKASADRISKEALYMELQSGDASASSLALNNPVIQALIKSYADTETSYNENRKIYKPDYPKMVQLKERLVQLKERIDQETKNVVKGFEKDYEAAVKRENYLKAALDQQKKAALELNQRSVQYQILKREADTNRELYNSLLQRLKETGVSASITSSNIQILDRAETPQFPFKPNKKLNILLSLIVGLFGGVGLAFFAEYLDNTVKTPEDIEKRLFMPSLGLVPLYQQKKDNKMPVEIITYSQEKNPVAEAYTSIRTFLLFSSAGRPPKVMLITSPLKEEGKTTTLINTAISLTKSGAKVLLIDGDMRRPRLHKIFKMSNTIGLSTFLSGNTEFEEIHIKKTPIKNLEILPSGPIPPNPTELLSSDRFKELLDSVTLLCDFILIDSPPLLGMADAAIAGTQTDGIILVVKAGQTPREATQQAKKILESVHVKVLGVVLNAMEEPHMKYGYYSYYRSYYQDDTADAKK